jgi:aspartate-semialdehyde dehydrogenase
MSDHFVEGLRGMHPASSSFDEPLPLRVWASCNHVPVIDGHTECVSVRFARRPPHRRSSASQVDII